MARIDRIHFLKQHFVVVKKMESSCLDDRKQFRLRGVFLDGNLMKLLAFRSLYLLFKAE